MTIHNNIYGQRYSTDEPCFFSTVEGKLVWNRVMHQWVTWASLVAKATRESHTWQPREIGIPSVEWLSRHLNQNFSWGPGMDTAALASEIVVNGEDWTGATGIVPPTGWDHTGVDGFIVTDGVLDIQGPVGSESDLTQTLTGTPGDFYVFEIQIGEFLQGASTLVVNGVTLPLLDKGEALLSASFQMPESGEVLVGFYLTSGARVSLDYVRCYLEAELTGQVPTTTAPAVIGPFMASGTNFWINTTTCAIGFNLDNDAEPDVWVNDHQVCQSDLTDAAKEGISAYLVMNDCPALQCVTASGSIRRAYSNAVLYPEGE